MNVKELIEKYEYLNHNYFRRVDTSEVLKDLRQLDEPEKVVIPQFVADWIEKSKSNGWDLLASMCFTLTAKNKQVTKWLHLGENVNIFARAWLDGYEVEKEKRYRVKMKNLKALFCYLARSKHDDYWSLTCSKMDGFYTTHTRKELEEAGFGWVFDCEGVEVEEVKE